MDQELNKVITELSKIDRAAGNAVADVDDSKSKLLAEFQLKKDAFAKELRDNGDARIAKMREELTAENDAEIAQLDEESRTRLEELESAFREKHTEWAQEIVNSILKEQ